MVSPISQVREHTRRGPVNGRVLHATTPAARISRIGAATPREGPDAGTGWRLTASLPVPAGPAAHRTFLSSSSTRTFSRLEVSVTRYALRNTSACFAANPR
jgi:hypothetical protein